MKGLVALAALILAMNAHADELQVVLDHGGVPWQLEQSYSLHRLFEPSGAVQKRPEAFDAGKYLSDLFPIQTGLKPGRFDKYEVSGARRVNVPLCFVGPDVRSRDWLRRNHGLLKKLGAMCFLINVESISDYEEMAGQLDVPLMAVPAKKMLERYKVRFYPALVLNGWVTQ